MKRDEGVNGEHWTDRLSEYLDGGLDELDHREAEAHLATCEACRTALEELREVVHRARNLVDREPEADLWPGIEAGIREADTGVIDLDRRRSERAARGPRALRFTVPQLAAAGIALVLATGALSWSLATQRAAPAPAVSVPASSVSAAAVESVDPEVSSEIARLQTTLDEYRDRLQPETIEKVERNLEVIDRAIVESLEALESDPANPLLRSLADRALQRKVEFLRGVSRIAGRAL